MSRALINAICRGIDSEGWRIVGYGGAWARVIRPVEAYIQKRVAKAIAAEREACAKVCDYVHELEVLANPAEKCAAAIRARGQA